MLTEKRKADREKMAAAIIALATECGATAAIDPDWPGERAIMIRIQAARGLRLYIDFDGDSSQPDVYVLSWHMSTDVDTCFADAFSRGGRVPLNSIHWRKATDVAYGFDALLTALRASLLQAQSGEAFSPEREAAAIAKAGETAAQRNARYDAWRTAERQA